MFNVASAADTAVLVPLVALVRLVAVEEAFVVLPTRFTVALSISRGDFDEPRKSVWRDNTVPLEHVDIERTACFTDSTGEPGSSVETVMVGGGGMKTVLQSLTIDDDGGSSHAFDVIMTAGGSQASALSQQPPLGLYQIWASGF